MTNQGKMALTGKRGKHSLRLASRYAAEEFFGTESIGQEMFTIIRTTLELCITRPKSFELYAQIEHDG
jgi:hypothetical protein